MLKFGLALSVLVSNLAFAAGSENIKYVCQEYKGQEVLPTTVVLTQTGASTTAYSPEYDYDVVVIPMLLEILKGTETYSSSTFKGTVETEDVSFTFTSEDKTARFHIYLDEMDQSSLTLVGSNGTEVKSSFVCR